MIRCSWTLTILAALALGAISGCGKNGEKASKNDSPAAENDGGETQAERVPTRPVSRPKEYVPEPSIYVNTAGPLEKPLVVLHTSAGDIKIELEIDRSPKTVLNFLNNYVRNGFYEETIFHYADAGSFVAGGGFTVSLEQKEAQSPIYNESNNGLSNVRGTIAMSREAESAHSATSQFFINVVDNPGLDYQGDDTDESRGYCVFGRVIEGMEIVDQIAGSPVRQEGEFEKLPVETVAIQSAEEL